MSIILSACINARAKLLRRNLDNNLRCEESTVPVRLYNSDLGCKVAVVNSQSCDYPATLSRSGHFMQCCEPGSKCNFFTACRNGTAVSPSYSVFCEEGFCNTAVIRNLSETLDSASYLACWPTNFGKSPFTLLRDPLPGSFFESER